MSELIVSPRRYVYRKLTPKAAFLQEELDYLIVSRYAGTIFQPAQQIFSKVMNIQDAFFVPVCIIAKCVYANIAEFIIVGKPFLRPKETWIFVLRPGFPVAYH